MGRGRRQGSGQESLRQSEELQRGRAVRLLESSSPAEQHEGKVLQEDSAARLLEEGSGLEELRPYRERWSRVLDAMPGRSKLGRIWENIWGQSPYQLARWAEAVSSLDPANSEEEALLRYLEPDLGNPPDSQTRAFQILLVEGVRATQSDPELRSLLDRLREEEPELRRRSQASNAPLFLLPHSGWYNLAGRPQGSHNSSGVFSGEQRVALVFGKSDDLSSCLGQDGPKALLYAARHELLHSSQPENMETIGQPNYLLASASREIREGLTELLNQSLGQSVPRPPYRQETDILRQILGKHSEEDLRRWNSQTLGETARELGMNPETLLDIWNSRIRPRRGPGG